jgi:hypothetical protein
MWSKTLVIAPWLLVALSLTRTVAAGPTRASTGKQASAKEPTEKEPTEKEPTAKESVEKQPTTKETAEKEKDKDKDKGDDASDDSVSLAGFSVSVRVGYALPMGSIAKDASLGAPPDLSKTAAGMVPFWGDVGYRINPHWYVGGYFQFGIIGTSGDWCNRAASGNDCSSSGTDLRFGGLVRYTISPSAKVSPWIGFSSGYEITNLSLTAGTTTTDATVKGWEFVGFHLGADFHAAPDLTIGPALMVSLGQYGDLSTSKTGGASSSTDFNQTTLHEWVFFGLRGQYDL